MVARLNELTTLTQFPADGLDRYSAELSGDQQRRVGLMRALMLDPEALLLVDGRRHFPFYDPVIFSRANLAQRSPGDMAALARLEGRIDARTIAGMNARVKLERATETATATAFVAESLGIESSAQTDSQARRLVATTLDHMTLVAISLGAAIVLASSLDVLAARRQRTGQVILATAGIIQTIPTLALLVFMIPLLGFGGAPAVMALFL